MVFFESPKRLIKTLSVMKETFLPSRQVVICREMTKLHEEVIRGSIIEILKKSFYPGHKGGGVSIS